MQKATPLVMLLILAVTAIGLSLRPHTQPPVKAPLVSAAVAMEPPTAPPSKASPEPPVTAPKPADGATAAVPVVASPVPASPWPQASSDIAPDRAITFGSFENGFRYIIQPNREPPGRVSLRLHIAAGSLMEAEDQRGLAHFLEHMVFNGTQHYSADELVPRMQRLGIAFGAHVNAFTSFDETVYMLDLPDLSAGTMDLGFSVMRDFADGALLAADEIDKERGVILSEKVSRDSVSYRLMEQQFAAILPDSLITRRFPIGTEEVIRSAPRARFLDLYKKFYTPQRMTFVVVGDVDPAAIRQRLETTFGTMVQAPDPASNPEMGTIREPERMETAVFHDKEVTSTDVSLTLVRPHRDEPDTTATRAKDMPLDIALAMIDRRFERIAKQKNSPIAEGSASHQVLFNAVELGDISVTAADDRWKEVVPIIEQEFRRAMLHGFTASELAEAKSNLLNGYQQAVKQQSTRKSDELASEIAKSLNDQSVLSSPETDLAIATRNLEAIDTQACHEAFKTFWEAKGYHLTLTTKTEPPNAESDMASLFEQSRSSPVEAPAARAIQVFDYTRFGKPGAITTRKEIKDLGITQLILSNKVRVNLKPTPFEQGQIRVLARIGSGKLSQPKAMPMLDDFAAAVFEGGGLGKHSNDDLQQILAGKNVSSSLAIDEDAFVISGSTTSADFAIQCQLMCASITDPGYREDALWQFKKAIPMIYQKINHTPVGPEKEMNAWLHGGDSRFSTATQKKLSSYTLADVKKWLTPELTKGYMELTIVGDFDTAKILPDLLATFGAMPARNPTAPAMEDARKIKFPNAPGSKWFTYQSKIAQGTACAIWKTAGIRGNQRAARRHNLLAGILGDRLRKVIREKLGASYAPNAGAAGSDALDGMGYIISESICKPSDIDLLLNTMRELADQLATQGANADELDRALKPIFGQLEKSRRDNQYWLTTVMSQSQADPKRLDLARGRDADYRSITLTEINALAAKYFKVQNAILVSIKPAL